MNKQAVAVSFGTFDECKVGNAKETRLRKVQLKNAAHSETVCLVQFLDRFPRCVFDYGEHTSTLKSIHTCERYRLPSLPFVSVLDYGCAAPKTPHRKLKANAPITVEHVDLG